MRDFLTALVQCSVSMSLVTLMYAAILPLLSKRYSAKWRYVVWLVIAVGWIFPFRSRIDLSFLPTQMSDMPVTPVLPIIYAIPSMADTGDIVNAPEIIPLWLVIAAIWILGVVGVVVYHALRHSRFMKMVRRWSEPVTDLESLGILDSLKSELGIKTQVRLSVCQSITSPMLVGFFRPVILLPPVKIAGDELSFILKHELIHLKRHDLWYKALICGTLFGGLVTACSTANTFTTVSQHSKATEWSSFMDSSFDSMTTLDLRTGTKNTYNDSEKILSVINVIKNMEISEQSETEQVKPGGFTYNITFVNDTDSVLITIPYFSVSNEDYNSAIYIAKDTSKAISDIENILGE